MIIKKPWGEIRAYALNQTCTVKLVEVEPYQETSTHYHHLRDDMWVILDEGLEVRIGDQVYYPHERDEFVIPAEQTHQIRSLGGKGRVLEINFGFTTEDDVMRVSDRYGREMEEGLEI